MGRFWTTKKWAVWAYFGAVFILGAMWYQVQLDVKINEWFGTFYNMIQRALTEPNSVTLPEYFKELLSFGKIATVYISVVLILSFFTSHWLFRWRTSMVEWYHSVYSKVSHIEGVAQRVQEDTVKFSRLMENLGVALVESVMILLAFVPVLWGLSSGLTTTFFGGWQYGLIFSAVVWSVGITLALWLAGRFLNLVGVEYDIQAREAAYRKVLVKAEDGEVKPKTFADLYNDVQSIHFTNYFRYLWFNVVRLACLQANVLVGYVVLAPTIVAGIITLGTMQQILRAFGRVEGSFMYLFKSWPTVIELLSVWKRLREFEKEI